MTAMHSIVDLISGYRPPLTVEEIERDMEQMQEETRLCLDIQVLIEKHYSDAHRAGHREELIGIAKSCGSIIAENHVTASQARATVEEVKRLQDEKVKETIELTIPPTDGHRTPQ